MEKYKDLGLVEFSIYIFFTISCIYVEIWIFTKFAYCGNTGTRLELTPSNSFYIAKKKINKK